MSLNRPSTYWISGGHILRRNPYWWLRRCSPYIANVTAIIRLRTVVFWTWSLDQVWLCVGLLIQYVYLLMPHGLDTRPHKNKPWTNSEESRQNTYNEIKPYGEIFSNFTYHGRKIKKNPKLDVEETLWMLVSSKQAPRENLKCHMGNFNAIPKM